MAQKFNDGQTFGAIRERLNGNADELNNVKIAANVAQTTASTANTEARKLVDSRKDYYVGNGRIQAPPANFSDGLDIRNFPGGYGFGNLIYRAGMAFTYYPCVHDGDDFKVILNDVGGYGDMTVKVNGSHANGWKGPGNQSYVAVMDVFKAASGSIHAIAKDLESIETWIGVLNSTGTALVWHSLISLADSNANINGGIRGIPLNAIDFLADKTLPIDLNGVNPVFPGVNLASKDGFIFPFVPALKTTNNERTDLKGIIGLYGRGNTLSNNRQLAIFGLNGYYLNGPIYETEGDWNNYLNGILIILSGYAVFIMCFNTDKGMVFLLPPRANTWIPLSETIGSSTATATDGKARSAGASPYAQVFAELQAMKEQAVAEAKAEAEAQRQAEEEAERARQRAEEEALAAAQGVPAVQAMPAAPGVPVA